MKVIDSLNTPHLLLIYDSLIPRINLPPEETQRYEKIQKGFIGEKILEDYLSTANYENLVPLYGNLLDVGKSEIQVDCMLLTAETIFLLEVKNYTGDYYIKDEKIYILQTDQEIFNPILQLERTELLFKRLLRERQINMRVRSFVIFVNFNFMLYNVPTNLPIIFPSQIKRFLQKTNANARPLTANVYKLAKMFMKQRKKESLYERLPNYDINHLKAGVFCDYCFSELKRETRSKFLCPQCQACFGIEYVVIRSIAQYHLLFPHKKITTQQITNWCGHAVSKDFVRKVLEENFNLVELGKHTHYLYKNDEQHLNLLANNYSEKR